jgi:hypothetical protein
VLKLSTRDGYFNGRLAIRTGRARRDFRRRRKCAGYSAEQSDSSLGLVLQYGRQPPERANRSKDYGDQKMAKKTLKKATKMESKKSLSMKLPIGKR